jgi:hypothetical protein
VAESVRRSSALLSATVRGLERAQGAIDAEALGVAERRLMEARLFAEDLGFVGKRTQDSLITLASELDAASERQPDWAETPPGQPWTPRLGADEPELPKDLQEQLRRTGVRQRELLLTPDEFPRIRRHPAESLRVVAGTFGKLGEELAEASSTRWG